MRFVPDGAFAAFVVHPRRAASSEIGQALLKLKPIQAGLQQEQIAPDEVERIIYAMGIPTDVSENDCTIVQFVEPIPRDRLLREEFNDLPYEEVKFENTTYYRYADESSVDEGVQADDTSGVRSPAGKAAPVGESTVLAKFPDDYQQRSNGHDDSSGSGNWSYYSSYKQNPTLPDAKLFQLRWSTQKKVYEAKRGAKGNTNPHIYPTMSPSPVAPHHAVVRWKSLTSGNVLIRGSFRKKDAAKTGNGVKVLVFVDGRQQLAHELKAGDKDGVDFEFPATIQRDSVVDFVVDPRGDYRGDKTMLTVSLERTGAATERNPEVVIDDSMEDEEELAEFAGSAIYFPDDKTLVRAEETWLRKLISGAPQQTPLKTKLAKLDLNHDLIGLVALEGLEDETAGLMELFADETGVTELADLAEIANEVNSALLTFDLTGDRLLRMSVESASEASASKLREGANQLVEMLQSSRAILPAKMPDSTANPLLPLFDDLVGGISVKQNAAELLVEVKAPSGLAEFIADDAEKVVSTMTPPRREFADDGSRDDFLAARPPRETSSSIEVELFNGESLSGWKYLSVKDSKNRANRSWFVDSERSVIFSMAGDRNELATVESFRDFELQLQWRWAPGREVSPNGSGIVIRSEGLNSSGTDPKGLEIDLRPKNNVEIGLGSGSFIAYNVTLSNHRGDADGVDNRILGWLREPTTRSEGEWNDLQISCVGDLVKVTLNGVLVNQGKQLSARDGKIVLRNQNSSIEFREMKLTRVKPDTRVAASPLPEFDSSEDKTPAVTRPSSPSAKPGFRELVLEAHDCRVSFPGKPEQEDQSIPTPNGKIEISTYANEYKGFTYSISVLDYPAAFVAKAGAKAILDAYRDGIVDDPNGVLLDSKVTNYKGSPSNDFQYVHPENGADGIAHARAVLKGKRMYFLKVDGKAPTADIHRFHGSLAFGDEPSPLAGDSVASGDGMPTSEAESPPKTIEPTEENWEVAAGTVKSTGRELVIDENGRHYWLISREALPANFRLQIEGRIEFVQGRQKLHNTQKDILRAMCVRFCTSDQKADILEKSGYHIRHTHTMLSLYNGGKFLARGDVGNGRRAVSAIPTADGLKVTIPDREPSPFTMIVTKNDDKIAVDFNGAKVIDHSDRFYLSTSDKLAIGGYLSRLYLGKVTITNLGAAKPPPEATGGKEGLVDSTTDRERFQPLLFRAAVDCMALTEDGRYVVAGHRSTDTVSLIDVQTLKVVKTIDTPAPAAILCRGDHLIVANYGLGTLTVFSQKKDWQKLKSITVGHPNPEAISAPGGRHYKGVVVVRCRGKRSSEVPLIVASVTRGKAVPFAMGRIGAGTVDYSGKVMIKQSAAGSPNRYIDGVYDFDSVARGRPSPKLGEHVDSFPLIYQVGATPYWFGGKKVFTGMPMKTLLEADRLLIPDRVVDVCYSFSSDRVRCVGLGRGIEDIASREITLPRDVQDVTDVGDLHIAATIGEHLYLFLLADRTIQSIRLPAFEIPTSLAKTDRGATVARAYKTDSEPDAGAEEPIKRTWKDASGRFEVEAELVEFKDGQVTLKKTDGKKVTIPADRLSDADREFLSKLN